MTKLNVYTAKGVKKASISMPKRFQGKENLELLAQAIRVYEAKRHPGLSKTKSRGEVSFSKAKIYRQKGTGRARHGARSAPLFVGGGVTHGPRGVKRVLNIPKKMRRLALRIALTLKSKDGQLIVVDGIGKLRKTKEAATLINKIARRERGASQDGRVTFVLSDDNKDAILALRNIKNVSITRFSDINAYQVYHGGTLVVDKKVLEEGRKKPLPAKKLAVRQKGL